MGKRTFFGFALANGMFSGDVTITRTVVTVEAARSLVEMGVIPCLNPSHQPTIDAMRSRYGMDVDVPESPPQVSLGNGDSLLVMGVRGLPRLTDRHEYDASEIEAASFEFVLYSVGA